MPISFRSKETEVEIDGVTFSVRRLEGETPALKLVNGSLAGAGEVVKLHFLG